MAQYRLSASVIGRSSGRSATAAAAYRAGERIYDRRTGQTHDYSRKGGVHHTEILCPDGAPAWMRNRSELWNGVEAAETRRNSQLAREIQLSLPHELTDQQRINLVRRFIEDQFVARGMVADLAVHEPSQHDMADDRNHHAHIMLTTRELLGEGFGKKARDWNDREVLATWREEWARYQNREFERLGLSVRVDHRSLEDQGILREPQKHMGPIATEIERDGRASHIGNDNRKIRAKNGQYEELERAGNVVDAKILFEQRKFDAWASSKRQQQEQRGHEAQAAYNVELAMRVADFERQLDTDFGETKHGLSRAQADVASRLSATGWRKFIRDITQTTRRDREELGRVEAEAAQIQRAEEARRAALRAEEAQQRATLQAEQRRRAEDLDAGIERARERREADQWAMGAGEGVKEHQRAQEASEREESTLDRMKSEDPLSDAFDKSRDAVDAQARFSTAPLHHRESFNRAARGDGDDSVQDRSEGTDSGDRARQGADQPAPPPREQAQTEKVQSEQARGGQKAPDRPPEQQQTPSQPAEDRDAAPSGPRRTNGPQDALTEPSVEREDSPARSDGPERETPAAADREPVTEPDVERQQEVPPERQEHPAPQPEPEIPAEPERTEPEPTPDPDPDREARQIEKERVEQERAEEEERKEEEERVVEQDRAVEQVHVFEEEREVEQERAVEQERIEPSRTPDYGDRER